MRPMLFRQHGICPGYLAGETLAAEMGFLTVRPATSFTPTRRSPTG